MFDPRLTTGGIQDDIKALSRVQLDDNGVNEFISSLVLKYIQAYFGAESVGEGLNGLVERLDQGGGGTDLFENPVNESYTLECLGCISQTSAILKEIIFHDGYEHDGSFRSCDMGAGTGILSLGAYISGLRKGLMKGVLHLMDHEQVSLERGREVLQAIVGSSFEVNSILGNIIKPSELEKIGEEKIQLWISETIGMGTPDFSINPTTGKVRMAREDLEFYKGTRAIAPFPEVVKNIMTHNQDLKQDVKSHRVALFPDYINGLYVGGIGNSTLDLQSSGNGKQSLGSIGNEFGYIKSLDENSRWRDI